MKSLGRASFFGLAIFCLLLLSRQPAFAQQVPPVSYLFVEVKDTSGKVVDDAAVTFSGARDVLKTNKEGVVESSFRIWTSLSSFYELKVSKPGYETSEHVVFPTNYHHFREDLPDAVESYSTEKPKPLSVMLSKTPSTPGERRAAELEGRKRQLLLAVKRSDKETLNKLLATGVGPDTPDAKGVPAIIWAAFTGDIEIINLLLTAGADVRKKDARGQQALLIYLASGVRRAYQSGTDTRAVEQRGEIVRKLIDAGADVNAQSPLWGTVLNSALTHAPYSNHRAYVLSVETIKLLVAKGADVNVADTSGKTPLMLAAGQKSVELIKLLLEAGASIGARDKEGKTALMYANGYKYDTGSLEAEKFLLAAGANVNDADASGLTPLMSATRGDIVEEVKLLLDAGAGKTINARDKSGKTALLYMWSNYFSGSETELTKIVVAAGANVNDADNDGVTPLMLTYAAYPDAPALKTLFDAGARATINAKDREGRTALMYAAKASDTLKVKMLLAAGASINLKDNMGQTALMYVALGHANNSGIAEIVNLLVSAGLNVNEANQNGQTTLMLAAQRRSNDLIKALIAHGAVTSINKKDKDGNTALLLAIPGNEYQPDLDYIQELISAGASVDDAELKGLTPLMLAAEAGSEKVIELLLASGASINAKDSQGRTALIKAAFHRRHYKAVELLLKAGADINAADNNGQTALMAAAIAPTMYNEWSDVEIVRQLMAAGANLKLTDKQGRTAVTLAKEAKNFAAVQLLEEAAARR